MNTKIALLIVYNHRFDQNIPRVESLYHGKFSHVFHLVPFYDGDKSNVIPVYAHSYYFQSYISQAYTHLRNEGFTHFFVVADDMLIHPSIDENNLWEMLGLDKDSCMISRMIEIQKRTKPWPRIPEAIAYKVKQTGVEIENVLPSKEKACELFAKHGISTAPINASSYGYLDRYKRLFKLEKEKEGIISGWFRTRKAPKEIQLDYPLVGGYSDIFLVTADVMPTFCSYCGAFAASHLFVELAVPTAMILSAHKITYIDELKLKGVAMWVAQDFQFLEPYNHSLSALIANYPEDKLYIHPIKLSKWK